MRQRNAILGLVGIALLVLLGIFVNFYLGGGFKSRYRVDAIFARAGQNLRDGSDVKLRGVLVGTVARTEVTVDGKARVVMNMFPSQNVPDNVAAAIRAKTLFGEKFVELRIVEPPSPQFLQEGDEIPESRTIPPFEVETILTRAVPLLEAIDPEKFGAAIAALAQGFVGNEQALRRATVQAEASLTQTQHTLPQLGDDIQHLRNFAAALDDSDTELLRALAGLQKAGEPIIAHADELRTILDRLPPLVRDLADIVGPREGDLADLSKRGAPVLESVAAKAKDLPFLASALDGFLGVWIADLSAGPFWRILVTSSPAAGTPYGPGSAPPGPQPATTQAARAQALAEIAGGTATDDGLAGLLLAPVPTADLQRLAGKVKR
jgi:virulence factor Mce-like protein